MIDSHRSFAQYDAAIDVNNVEGKDWPHALTFSGYGMKKKMKSLAIHMVSRGLSLRDCSSSPTHDSNQSHRGNWPFGPILPQLKIRAVITKSPRISWFPWLD